MVDVRKLADEFFGTLQVQGYSPSTVGNYGKYIEKFFIHIDKEGKDVFCQDRKSPTCIDHSCLLRWMQAIRLTGVKETSLQANKSAVSSWYKWLIRIGKVERNPIDMVAPIKIPETDPKPLPVNDTIKVLESVDQMKSWRLKDRNRAMLETFYASGIRRAELIALDVTDLSLEAAEPHFIIRQGKGKRDGIGRLTPPAVEAIRKYLPIRARLMRKWERPVDTGPLFPSRTGGRLDPKSLWKIVWEIGDQVLKKHIHPHQFRHSFCTDLLNNGADLESIRKLARHKDLSTTQKYLSVSTTHLNKAYGMHPRNKPKEPE